MYQAQRTTDGRIGHGAQPARRLSRRRGPETERVHKELIGQARKHDGTPGTRRRLEGLNFRIDPVTRQLVDAGPVPAAVA